MNRLKLVAATVFLIALVFDSERRLCGCVLAPEPPLKGDWNLTLRLDSEHGYTSRSWVYRNSIV